MTKKLIKLITKYGSQLCVLVAIASPVISQCCRFLWYQPEEPEDLAAFAKKQKK